MPTLIPRPTRIQAAGTRPKIIEEFVGRVNSGTVRLSAAHLRSPVCLPAFSPDTVNRDA
jgi:hypothetical protein